MATVPSPFTDTLCPNWAETFGQDRYGYYADFVVPADEPVTQRMRWIPAGTFLMGSPESEPERFEREVQHEVTFTDGFWLADTTCCQTLWKVVMGDSPSHFEGDDLPVEQVNYEDVARFLDRTNEAIPGLSLTLPTEAQWEYACRAGTTTPFNTGDQLTTDQANYDGNHPYNEGPKGECRKETVPVRSFEPNGWGLYQMHGNVWEWCQDWYDGYSPQAIQDPNGPQEGSGRVVRGGSWLYSARLVRSAYRNGYTPDDRSGNLGFRCLSPASSSPTPPNK